MEGHQRWETAVVGGKEWPAAMRSMASWAGCDLKGDFWMDRMGGRWNGVDRGDGSDN